MKRLFSLLCFLLFTCGIFASSNALADAVDDTAKILDHVPPGSLPFTGNDVRTYKALIVNCESASDFDQVLQCVDNAAKDDAIAENAEIPSWFPTLLDVYFDIKNHDYWSLLADAGEVVACAAAQILADGFDVCGLIKDILETAKKIAETAEAVGKFFADLGSSIANVASDIACAISSLWGGCSSDSPPPPSDSVAYAGYYFPRVQNGEGLNKRLSGSTIWHNYAGQWDTDNNAPIINNGVQAGMPKDGMIKALPAFWKAVYAQWDGKVVGELIPKVKQAAAVFNTPSAVQKYVSLGQANWSSVDAYLGSVDNPIGVAMGGITKPGMDACVKAITDAGAKQVDDWVAEGRIQKSGLSGISWPSNYFGLCDSFHSQLIAALKPWAGQKAIEEAGCPLAPDGSGNYYCGNIEVTLPCRNGMVTLGQPPARCINKGPAPGQKPKLPYSCGGGVCKLYVMGEQPSGCKVLQIKDAQQLCSDGSPDGGGIHGLFNNPNGAAQDHTGGGKASAPNVGVPAASDNDTGARSINPIKIKPINSLAVPNELTPPPPPASAPATETRQQLRPMMRMLQEQTPESQLSSANCVRTSRSDSNWKCSEPRALALCQSLQSNGKVSRCDP